MNQNSAIKGAILVFQLRGSNTVFWNYFKCEEIIIIIIIPLNGENSNKRDLAQKFIYWGIVD